MVEKVHGFDREQLLEMDVGTLRTLLHERTHHRIEVLLYRILKGKYPKPGDFGEQPKFLLDIWRERGLNTDTPDIQWCIQNIEIAEKLNRGEEIELDTELPTPFTSDEMEVVKKLLYERRSIRQFTDEPVPEWMINEIIYAGIMSPQGCNVDARRFIILRDPKDWSLVTSDIPLENGVMIIVCQDLRGYQALTFDTWVPQNLYYDVATAADHICLMAHAFGLGACWLSHGEDSQKRVIERFNLPDTILSRCHIILGWPDEAPLKSLRMSIADSIITE
jgi:nitroreductase